MAFKYKKKSAKEHAVLIGLVELYLETGKPIGSNTLRESGFEDISSATIRNYFAKLEAEGFLKQQHSSGGRVPTECAYQAYAEKHHSADQVNPKILKTLKKELSSDTKEIAFYLQHASEILSELTQGAIFLVSPRFDQDLVTEVKLVSIDAKRCLCILITDFGLVHTEILQTPKKLSRFSLKRLESYFHFRMTGLDRPKLSQTEEEIGAQFYNEILLRHIVGHTNFTSEDVYKTGFSRLLNYPEFRDAATLASGLSLFENTTFMQTLLRKCTEGGELQFWIGDALNYPGLEHSESSVIAIPYFIHGKAVGAIAVLTPIRVPYPKLFGLIRAFSEVLSDTLTRNLYKYKITYRQPAAKQLPETQTPAIPHLNSLKEGTQDS